MKITTAELAQLIKESVEEALGQVGKSIPGEKGTPFSMGKVARGLKPSTTQLEVRLLQILEQFNEGVINFDKAVNANREAFGAWLERIKINGAKIGLSNKSINLIKQSMSPVIDQVQDALEALYENEMDYDTAIGIVKQASSSLSQKTF